MPFLHLEFRNPTHPHLGIEVMRLSELRRRMAAPFFLRVQRPHFHLLALYVEGHAVEEVDFVRLDCRPGALVHVHPGQVLRYVTIERAEAILVLFTPEFVPTESALTESPDHVALAGADLAAVRGLFDTLEQAYAATDAGKLAEAMLRHLLMALLLRVELAAARSLAAPPAPFVQQQTFQRFRKQLEQDFTRTRAVQDYAHGLGCAPRTLNRATLAIAGLPVKQFIDERVALEAKRLLAHTPLSVAEIATSLGFSEPTNFVKFFRRSTGLLPGAFREAQT